jgi:surfactin synthase thioesterase subunit
MRPTLQLHCFPYAGASADLFLRWRRSLPPWIEPRAVELPGRGRRLREPPALTMTRLVETLLPAFEALPPRSFAFFGHSMGAALAFELCVALHARGRALPLVLFASSAPAPCTRSRALLPDVGDSDEALRQALRRMGGTPESVLADAELMELVLPVLRADFQLCASYRPSSAPPLPCPIHAFSGREDSVTELEVDAWRQHTASSFGRDVLPGNHFYLHAQEARLTALVSERLSKGANAGAGALAP